MFIEQSDKFKQVTSLPKQILMFLWQLKGYRDPGITALKIEA